YHYCYLLLHAPTTTEIYTLSLHDALPICLLFARQFAPLRECFTIYHHDTALMRTHIPCAPVLDARQFPTSVMTYGLSEHQRMERSEEHTSELQSRENLVCRLLLEKKKQKI